MPTIDVLGGMFVYQLAPDKCRMLFPLTAEGANLLANLVEGESVEISNEATRHLLGNGVIIIPEDGEVDRLLGLCNHCCCSVYMSYIDKIVVGDLVWCSHDCYDEQSS